MANKVKKKPSISEQIKAALDGRTQRWLAHKVNMAEDKLSNKLNGYDDFSHEEIEAINKALEIELR